MCSEHPTEASIVNDMNHQSLGQAIVCTSFLSVAVTPSVASYDIFLYSENDKLREIQGSYSRLRIKPR